MKNTSQILKRSIQLLLVLSVLLSITYSQDICGNQLLTTQEIADDSVIPSLVNLGIQTITTAASQAKQCTDCNFTLSQVKSVYRQIVTGVTYQFNCEFKNSQNTVLTAAFTIFYDAVTPTSNVTTFSYSISSSSSATAANQYIQITPAQAQQDSTIKKCLDYGTTQSVQSASSSGQLSSSQYSLNQVVSVYAQSTATGTNYQFTCLLKSQSNAAPVQTTFTVYLDLSTGQTSLSASSYSSSSSSSFSSSFSTSTNTTSSSSSIAITNTSDSATYTAANTTNSTTPAVQAAVAQPLIQVSAVAVLTNPAIEDAQAWGSNAVITKGIAAGKIPSGTYNIIQVVSVAQQTTSKASIYQFNLLMASTAGVQLALTYKVSYTVSTQAYSLQAYSYKIKNIKSNGGASGGYIQLSDDGIKSSTAVQAAINYGINTVKAMAISQNKIPNTPYSISQLGAISQSVVSSGTNYKVNVLLGNTDGVQLIINATVNFKLSNQKYSLNAYSFSATNIKSTSSSSSTYTQLQGTQVSNSEVQGCLTYGVQQLIKNYQSYSVQTINSVFKKTQNSAAFYKFDVVLKKNKGNGSAQLNFVVSYQASLKQYFISSYSYHYSSSSSSSSSSWSSSSWSSYSSSSYSTVISTQSQSNSAYNSALQYGVSQCLQNLQTNNIIPLTYFSLNKVTKAFSQTVSSGTTNYVFQAVFTDSSKTTISATFTVQYKSSSKSLTLLSYQVNSQVTSQSSTTVAIYTSSSSQAVQATTCQSFSSSQWSSSSVQSVITYGMQEVIKNLSKISTFSSFSSSSFSVSNIQSVAQSSYDSSVYNIQATFKNQAGKSVDCNYQVQAPTTGTKKLNSYSYVCY